MDFSPALTVADFVDDEQDIEEIATGAQPLGISVWVDQCGEQRGPFLSKEGDFVLGGDDCRRILQHPLRCCGRHLVVVGIE